MNDPSGRFVIRIPPSLHLQLRQFSFDHGISLNECCRHALEEFFADHRDTSALHGREAEWVAVASDVLGDKLVGVALFGSTARGEETSNSDIDLLIVCESSVPLSRALYSSWDHAIEDATINPHFVHVPDQVFAAGSLWYEIAIDGIILFENGRRVANFLRSVRKAIADGEIERRNAYGHGYWIKHQPEGAHAQ